LLVVLFNYTLHGASESEILMGGRRSKSRWYDMIFRPPNNIAQKFIYLLTSNTQNVAIQQRGQTSTSVRFISGSVRSLDAKRILVYFDVNKKD